MTMKRNWGDGPFRQDGPFITPRRPNTGTLRLYVDGTNGDDTAQGTSWATAWKTLAQSQSQIEAILATNPGNLRLDLYVRGAFANEDLILSGALAGLTTVNVIHHVDDWTEVDTGTVNTVAATALAHGMMELTFNAPWVPAAADQGRWLVFTEGTNRIVYQILRVSAGTVTISTSTVPAWLIGGGTVAVSVREPSVSGIRTVNVGYQRGCHYQHDFQLPGLVILGLACDRIAVIETEAVFFLVKATGLLPVRVASCYYARSWVSSDGYILERTRAAEYGLLGANITDTCRAGSWTTDTTSSGSPSIGGGETCALAGYFSRAPSFLQGGGTHYVTYACLPGIEVSGSGGYMTNVMFSAQAIASHQSFLYVEKTSWLGISASGVPEGLLICRKGGWVQVKSTVDGNNTGTGAGLYGCKIEKGGKIQVDSSPTAITGDDGDWYIDDGEAEFSAALTIAARKGDGPDIYVGPNARVHFGGNVTKSATNPSGGGTANSILRCRRGAKVTQAAGSSFTLPAGSGNNTTDYGANGAIDAETGCTVVLGTPAGGGAAATGVAVRIKKGSTLAHTGAAPSWGVAPVDLGGNAAAISWPAAASSDLAAVTPENCWILPGAA